ncbi:hypothetical protein SAMN05421690_100736 [Nitrosomonas sp. Nm51]|nr:hypothetical protein SAMN05421690_100736 [Nitrosomonas sp. Nm51]
MVFGFILLLLASATWAKPVNVITRIGIHFHSVPIVAFKARLEKALSGVIPVFRSQKSLNGCINAARFCTRQEKYVRNPG